MTEENPITADDVASAATYTALGPAYFAARRFAEKLFDDSEQFNKFEDVAKEAAKKVADHIRDAIAEFIACDAEYGVHQHIWREVDQIVRAILSGEKWAVERYALGGKYDFGKIRAAVAKHIPREVMDARIGDLEAEVKTLSERLRFYQER